METSGIKVSGDNIDISADSSLLAFTSSKPTLKILQKGTLTLTFPYNSTESNTVDVFLDYSWGDIDGNNNIFVLSFGDYGSGPNKMPFEAFLGTRFIGMYVYSPYYGNFSFNAIRTTNTSSQFNGTYPDVYSCNVYYYIVST